MMGEERPLDWKEDLSQRRAIESTASHNRLEGLDNVGKETAPAPER
jgi:hypothetical protein